IQVAGRPVVSSCLALSGKADTVAVVDARRNLDREVLRLRDAATAVTVWARIHDDAAGAFARGTGLLDREEPLLHADLAYTATGGTTDRLGALCRSAAAALFAADLRRDLYRDFVAAHGALKIQPQFVGKVGSTKNLAAPPAAAAAKDIAEDVAEDIPESLRSESAGASPAQPFMPELVIGCAF